LQENHYEEVFKDLDAPNKEQVIEIFKKAVRHSNEKLINDMLKQFRRNVSILSLSETPTSLLMWSHYSDSHKGFVIEYDYSRISYNDPNKRFCFPVFYSPKPRNITRYLSRGLHNDFNNLFGSYQALLKSDAWSYEQEWRIIVLLGQQYANYKNQNAKTICSYYRLSVF